MNLNSSSLNKVIQYFFTKNIKELKFKQYLMSFGDIVIIYLCKSDEGYEALRSFFEIYSNLLKSHFKEKAYLCY